MQPGPLTRAESASATHSSPAPAELHALGLPDNNRAGVPKALLEAARVPAEVLEERQQGLVIEDAPSD